MALERDGYPAGVPCWIDTTQADPQAAARFYGGLFGWEFEEVMPAGAGGHYLMARLRGFDVAAVGSLPPGGQPTWNTYVWVDNADETTARVQQAGGQVIAAPLDVMDAGRMATFADPDGAPFNVWQAGRHRGARIVNENCSWNSSDLTTRDAERAKAFYGSVFGWQVSAVDFGFGESYMLRMPGYGDHLEARYPGTRQRHIEAGAPEGFTDSIGWLQVEADATPEWVVSFSVDDTDAIAARANELGGTVTVPPMDMPEVRLAIITDPQGVVFRVSTYTPSSGA